MQYSSINAYCLNIAFSLNFLFISINRSKLYGHVSSRLLNRAGAKSLCLCTEAITKSNCEDNPVQRIVAIGAIVDI